MTPAHLSELREVFLYTRDEHGLDAALEAVVLASRTMRISSLPSDPVVMMACEMFDITRLQFVGKDRHADLCDARAVAAQVMRGLGMSYSAIARKLGRDNHTTVMASLQRCGRRPDLKQKSEEIAAKLAGSPVLRDQRNEAA